MSFFRKSDIGKPSLLNRLDRLLSEIRARVNALVCLLTDFRGLPITYAGLSEAEDKRRFLPFSLYLYSLGDKVSRLTDFGGIDSLIVEGENYVAVIKRLKKPAPKMVASFLLGKDAPVGLVLCEMSKLEEEVARLFSVEQQRAEDAVLSSNGLMENREVDKILDELEKDPLFKTFVDSIRDGG